MPWVYSGLGAAAMGGLIATVFTLRHIWKRRTIWIGKPEYPQKNAQNGASIVEDMVMNNTKGF